LYRLSNAEVPIPAPASTRPIPEPYHYSLQQAVSGVSSSGSAGELGVGFTGFVTSQIGLHVGLGISLHNIGVNVDSLKTFTENNTDLINNETRNLFSALYGYRETYRTFSLSVPLMIQFQTMQNQGGWNRRNDVKQGFYAMAGVKLNILLSNTYESQVSSFYASAHYVDKNNWTDTQNFAGFGTFKGKNSKGDFGYIQALLAVEAGMKWRISDNMYLYTGAYLDYGLNDPTKNSRKPTSDFIHPDNLPELTLLEFADRTNLFVIGVKLRLAFIKYFDQLSCPQF